MFKYLIIIACLFIGLTATANAATLSVEMGVPVNIVSYRTTDLSYSAMILKKQHTNIIYSEYKLVLLDGSPVYTAAVGLQWGPFSTSVGPARMKRVPYGLSGHWQFDLTAGIDYDIGRFNLSAKWHHFSRGKKVFGGSGSNHGLDYFASGFGINF